MSHDILTRKLMMHSNKISYANTLLFGSTSDTRKILLEEAKIPFACIPQVADEKVCSTLSNLPDIVRAIVLQKMDHVVLPVGSQGEKVFVLTADTLSSDITGTVHGKPVDRQDAIAKLRIARQGVMLVTAFCLDRKIWLNGTWHVEERHIESVATRYSFDVPDHWLDLYFEHSMGLSCAGAIAVGGFGGQFLRHIDGSYSAVRGLPMIELREALEKLGFFTPL